MRRLLSILVLTCAAPQAESEPSPIPYHADIEFTAEERIEILRATNWLARLTGRPFLILYDRESAARVIHRHPYGKGGCADLRQFSQVIHIGMLYTGTQGTSTQAQDVATITAHELGHTLGMGHVKDPHALMAPDWTPGGFRWNPDDAAEWERAKLITGWIQTPGCGN